MRRRARLAGGPGRRRAARPAWGGCARRKRTVRAALPGMARHPPPGRPRRSRGAADTASGEPLEPPGKRGFRQWAAPAVPARRCTQRRIGMSASPRLRRGGSRGTLVWRSGCSNRQRCSNPFPSIVVLRGCTGSPGWPRGAWRQRSPRAGEAGHVQAETDGAGSTRPPAPGPPRGSRGAGGTASGGGAARATPEGETSLAADARQGRSACSVSRP